MKVLGWAGLVAASVLLGSAGAGAEAPAKKNYRLAADLSGACGHKAKFVTGGANSPVVGYIPDQDREQFETNRANLDTGLLQINDPLACLCLIEPLADWAQNGRPPDGRVDYALFLALEAIGKEFKSFAEAGKAWNSTCLVPLWNGGGATEGPASFQRGLNLLFESKLKRYSPIPYYGALVSGYFADAAKFDFDKSLIGLVGDSAASPKTAVAALESLRKIAPTTETMAFLEGIAENEARPESVRVGAVLQMGFLARWLHSKKAWTYKDAKPYRDGLAAIAEAAKAKALAKLVQAAGAADLYFPKPPKDPSGTEQ